MPNDGFAPAIATRPITALDDICSSNWSSIGPTVLAGVARAYYFFSVQFRENLQIACQLYPKDELLRRLAQEECATDNLSPWPGVAEPLECMDHDEFMRRILHLSPLLDTMRSVIDNAGITYLARVRAMDLRTRAASIASYEDGGLERVFRAILRAPNWNTPLLRAFQHFLVSHIAFDSDPDQGHGALSRHLDPGEDVGGLWQEFLSLLEAIPGFDKNTVG